MIRMLFTPYRGKYSPVSVPVSVEISDILLHLAYFKRSKLWKLWSTFMMALKIIGVTQ